MRRSLGFCFCLTAGILILAQSGVGQPADPPALLPPSITSPPAAGAAAPPVVPASAKKVGFPADRFLQEPHKQPPPTMHAVYSSRSAAEWLCRLNQASGRFMAGVNPSLARPLPDNNDFHQALAAVAVARAATFTGDEKLTACAGQSVLALLTLAPEDSADRTFRAPRASSTDRGNRVGFAAALALAIYDMPRPDPKLIAEADRLCEFLRKQCREDGSVHYTDGASDVPARVDPEGAGIYPGLCFEALMASDRHSSAAWKRDIVARGVAYYREQFKANPTSAMAAHMLPAVVELSLRGKNEAAAAFGFELADRLCDLQYGLDDARDARWVGGFRAQVGAATEPTAVAAAGAEGLAAAIRLAANMPDIARFTKYRKACQQALMFGRGLQFSEETTAHFEKKFRTTFLLGGVCGSPSEGNPRIDHTSRMVSAQLRFLESGGERDE